MTGDGEFSWTGFRVISFKLPTFCVVFSKLKYTKNHYAKKSTTPWFLFLNLLNYFFFWFIRQQFCILNFRKTFRFFYFWFLTISTLTKSVFSFRDCKPSNYLWKKFRSANHFFLFFWAEFRRRFFLLYKRVNVFSLIWTLSSLCNTLIKENFFRMT